MARLAPRTRDGCCRGIERRGSCRRALSRRRASNVAQGAAPRSALPIVRVPARRATGGDRQSGGFGHAHSLSRIGLTAQRRGQCGNTRRDPGFPRPQLFRSSVAVPDAGRKTGYQHRGNSSIQVGGVRGMGWVRFRGGLGFAMGFVRGFGDFPGLSFHGFCSVSCSELNMQVPKSLTSMSSTIYRCFR